MAIFYVSGDLFLSGAQTLGHGCTTRGRMGRGIAVEFRHRFPAMFAEYRRRCRSGALRPGGVFLDKSTTPWVLNLATQADEGGAELGWVGDCLQWIARNWRQEGIASLALPRIGAGLGGLEWDDVTQLLEQLLGPLDLPVFIYERRLDGVKAEEARPVIAAEPDERREPVLFGGRRRGHYRELSNFAPYPILVDGEEWATVEHFYQSNKTTKESEREEIRAAPTPKQAKRLGNALAGLPPDWEQRKLEVMRRALWAKFTQHPALAELLLATGEREIHEDSPYDAERGWKSGAGRDLLGKLLVEVRAELRRLEARSKPTGTSHAITTEAAVGLQ